jgi:hypothetical protein
VSMCATMPLSVDSFVIQQQQQPSVVTPSAMRCREPRLDSLRSRTSALSMFGNNNNDHRSDKELGLYRKLATGQPKFESLSMYVVDWAKTLETNPKGAGLTTKVKVLESSTTAAASSAATPMDTSATDVVERTDVAILFQKRTGMGYADKDRANANANNKNGSGAKPFAPQTVAKEQSDDLNQSKQTKTEESTDNKTTTSGGGGVSEGGIVLSVERLDTNEVRVRARRCNIDEDTVIKEMSEEAILNQLKKALDVWKKELSN